MIKIEKRVWKRTIQTQLHVENKQRMEWDTVSGLLCRSLRHPCIVYFSLHRRPEGGGNYLVARQRAAVIALCIARMAAVNMDVGACAAVGGQVLMLIKWEGVCSVCVCLCARLQLCLCLCVFSWTICVRFLQMLAWKYSSVCITSHIYLNSTTFVCVCVSSLLMRGITFPCCIKMTRTLAGSRG